MRYIPGYENLYCVDVNGNVFSKNGKLKPNKHRQGYLKVRLYKNKNWKDYFVHRLVALTYLGPSSLICNHVNGVKDDNRLCNLEYCTNQENVKHAFKTGLCKGLKGSKNPASKLTEHKVKVIKELLLPIFNNVEIAEMYNINRGTVWGIRKNREWKHI